MNADSDEDDRDTPRVFAILQGANLRGWNHYCDERELWLHAVPGYLICGEFHSTIQGFHRLYETIVDEVNDLNDGTVSSAIAKSMTSSRLIKFMEDEVPVVKARIASRIGVHSIGLFPRENGAEHPGNFVGPFSSADQSLSQHRALCTVGAYISQLTNIGREIERLIDLEHGESFSSSQIFDCMEDLEKIDARVDEFFRDSAYDYW